jgi:hypothetical protein
MIPTTTIRVTGNPITQYLRGIPAARYRQVYGAPRPDAA